MSETYIITQVNAHNDGGGRNEENDQWTKISKEKTQVKLCLLNGVGNMKKKTEKKDNNPGLNPIHSARGTWWQKWGSVSR